MRANTGRQDTNFRDDNQSLVKDLLSSHPDVETLEMETGMLYHLASVCQGEPMFVSGCAMVFANRKDGSFIDKSSVESLEEKAGRIVLETLTGFQNGEPTKNFVN